SLLQQQSIFTRRKWKKWKSRGDECLTDSLDDDAFSSCSSSKYTSESFSSKWYLRRMVNTFLMSGTMREVLNISTPRRREPGYTLCSSDLLLGGDLTGGRKGVQTALALSNAISHLANSVFGELWKLEPLSEDNKQRWRREMDWLLSPCNHMIELVPSKLHDKNGRSLEETLDSMVSTEFWYSEVGRRAEGKNEISRESRRWWLPSPKVPKPGLSSLKELLEKGNVVYQSFKAAKSINEEVLLEMPIPTIIKDSLLSLERQALGMNCSGCCRQSRLDEIFVSLRLRTEHSALETVNRLEAAIYAWKERLKEQQAVITRIEPLINKAERLNGQINPNTLISLTRFLMPPRFNMARTLAMQFLRHTHVYLRVSVPHPVRIRGNLARRCSDCFSGSNDLFRTPERLLSPLAYGILSFTTSIKLMMVQGIVLTF
ncbi:LOW QUALITY PROTEIN: hypothetical protein HID58_095415, partial [Brassica napus]